MSWKTFVADYLTFTRKERIAVIAFCVIILFVYLIPQFYPAPPATAVHQDTALQHLLDSGAIAAKSPNPERRETEASAYRYEVSKNDEAPAGVLFPFDPNTLDAEGWKKLGLRDRTVQTILHYREKGGHFYKPDDVQKIWGLPNGFYSRVKGYIQIAAVKKDYGTSANPSTSPGGVFFKTPYERSERRLAAVDVNTADTSALIALPGIGSKLAQRILNFRDKLGGFYSADQIGETYGLPDSTFQKLKPYLQVHGGLKKLNLNTATKDDLKAHPYIRWNLANAIVEYRTQHGPFKKLDDLKNIMLIDDATYNKIAPYLDL
jgi:DNA uptake protein ComE-like DNA-binding protein